MNTELLKKKILQLAMQGKLVEQDESEGTADELISQILEEKKKMMIEGKIKKEKLSKIYKNPTDNHYYEKFEDGMEKDITDEIPYELPYSWSWQRIGTYAEKVTDEVASGSFQSIRDNVKTYKEENYALMVKTADFSNNFTNNLTYTDKHGYEFLSNSNLFGGELILCNIGSIGKVFIVPNLNKKMTLAPNSIMIRLINTKLKDFLYYILQSPYGFTSLMDKSSGTGRKKLNKKDFKSILIPIPPIGEQFRICKKITEILSKINNIDKSYNKIATMYKELKSKIIDLAIKGQLTKQLSTDEPSSKLIENILEIKHKLMKEGKIRKENLSIIYKDSDNQFYEKFDDGINITQEIPFDVPSSWSWSRLRNIGIYKKGPFGSSLTKSMFVPKGENTIKVYEQKNAINKNYKLGNYYITKQYFNESMSGFEVEPGDIIVSCAGTIGETYILPSNMEKGIINQALMKMKIFNNINKEFFLIYFDQILKNEAIKNGKGTAMKNIPPFTIFKEYLIPIPPFEEQERIINLKNNIINYLETAE